MQGADAKEDIGYTGSSSSGGKGPENENAIRNRKVNSERLGRSRFPFRSFASIFVAIKLPTRSHLLNTANDKAKRHGTKKE